MKLIVGLGNPGTEYKETRHNIGFKVVERLARALQIRIGKEKFQASYGAGQIGDEKILLALPQTFMNLSGVSIGPFMKYWKLFGEDLLVVHDDLDFPLGVIRLAFDAGAAGHRGVESTIEELGTKEFYRLRLGIGKPEGEDPVSYVLSQFEEGEKKVVREVIDQAALAARTWVIDGPDAVKRRFHRSSPDSRALGPGSD